MEKIIDKIRQLYPLPDSSLAKVTSTLEKLELSKGHILFKAGSIASKIYFIEQGIVRGFTLKGQKEVTFWFGSEGDFVVSYYSYIARKPGYGTVELLEDSILYSVDITTLQELFKTDIDLANCGRKLAEYELIKTEERFIAVQFQTAIERYKSLLQYSPQLIQRVQLKHIASYLGVTQVTLSRIRSEITL